MENFDFWETEEDIEPEETKHKGVETTKERIGIILFVIKIFLWLKYSLITLWNHSRKKV